MYTLIVLAVCLLVLGLLFGKRFGAPVLALVGGLVVSEYMSATLVSVATPYLKQWVAYVPPLIVVLPALLLLIFMKGRHRLLIPRILSAVVFAVAGLVFVIVAPTTPESLTGSFKVITNNAGIIVTVLIVLAVLEIAFGKASKKKLDDGKK